MHEFSEEFDRVLRSRDSELVVGVEFYSASLVESKGFDLSTPEIVGDAFGLFAKTCYYWQPTGYGPFKYEPKVLNFSDELLNVMGEDFNKASVELANVERGKKSGTNFVLNNRIKGSYIVFRLLSPDAMDDFHVLWWGKCLRPESISNKSLTISALQEFGNLDQEIPFGKFQASCPLDFARPGGDCLGSESLEAKTSVFEENFARFGSAGCISQFGSKNIQTCKLLGNDKFIQGQPLVAVSGQFQYVTYEEVIKRVLFFTKKKKVAKVNTIQWSSVNQSDSDEVIPVAVGRVQIQGHPIVWADTGTDIISLQGFCAGRINSFNFIKCRTFGLSIVGTPNQHLGEFGGVGTQQLDPLFNGAAGYLSRLAYMGITTTGSAVNQVDDAPVITAVIRALEVPLPSPDGLYGITGWTNNPIHLVRYFMSDKRYGRIPFKRFDIVDNINEADYCNSLVEDRTQSEEIILPSNVAADYGLQFRRYRSSGRWSAYKDMYYNGGLTILGYPEFEEPFIDWFTPFQPPPLIIKNVVLRQLYTCNGVLKEKIKLIDFINKFLLPVFKGYILYGYDGKIKIRSRKKADNSFVREDSAELDKKIKILNIRKWLINRKGYLIIGVNQLHAEVRKVKGIEYSPAGNSIPLQTSVTGTLTATSSGATLSGGSLTSPARGHIDIGGTVTAGDKVEVRIDETTKQFAVSYTTDGIEDLAGVTRMLNAHLNANPQFNQYLYSYILPGNPTRIHIVCDIGALQLDRSLEYEHLTGEEVMRVVGVFENCSDLDADASAQFDNIVDDSFLWNDEQSEDINAVTARYISAVDDFRLTELQPRVAWDTADLDGALKKKELDLTFVDNYWQAAFLTKSEAIEKIDGDLHFSFKSGIYASRLEVGDVVAVRHDTGDGALRYLPCWVQKVAPSPNDFTVNLGLKLYLSAAFDLSIQPIEQLLTTTLNGQPLTTNPPPLGTSGGIGGGTEPIYNLPTNHIETLAGMLPVNGIYSPQGKDIIGLIFFFGLVLLRLFQQTIHSI